ncbi:hypothetical protein GIB67_003685 [Kingdonia uniflora]|uniref:Uncharacterized protein n=1 Tax=Kingdonia uniflora TaxID=39325 RepID=A0A7J7M3U2_9MAGN|nr:hypothetical protein GIB67_003685 [Kingdonia uniflora]
MPADNKPKVAQVPWWIDSIKTPAATLCLLYANTMSAFNRFVSKEVAERYGHDSGFLCNVLLCNEHLVGKNVDSKQLVIDRFEDPKNGARDVLVSFLRNIDFMKVEDKSLHFQLTERITNSPIALLECGYTKAKR